MSATVSTELLLRVSFRSPGAVCDLSRKFGCDPEDLLALARLAAELGIQVPAHLFAMHDRFQLSAVRL